jgi:A/G-specific adenine glycosylase
MWSQLLIWSQKEFEHLPWRRNRSLYGTLVSEIMLQQTTVGTVLQHFDRFLNQFPDLKSLAMASEEELLVAWKGLGYYRRAKNLKKIAETIVFEHKGVFPDSSEELQKINGIGPYTANALIAIGLDRPALAVDANLERVLSRIFAIQTPKGPRLQKQILQLFIEKKLIADRHFSFRSLNEALMDLGRTICQASRVSCEICPMKKSCQSFKSGKPLNFPLTTQVQSKKKLEHELRLLRILIRRDGNVLAYQKIKGEWLEGQWEVPTFVIETDDNKFKQYPELNKKLSIENLPIVKTGITKYNIQNYVLELSQAEWKKWSFPRETVWRESESHAGNLSTASLKCLKIPLR